MESIQEYKNYWERRKHKKWVNEIFVNYSYYLEKLTKKEVSKSWDLQHVMPFFDYLEKNNLKQISIDDVYDYVKYQKDKYAPKTVYNRKIALRFLLNQLYANGKIKFDGNMVFPTIKNVEGAKLISYYSNQEIKKVIDSMPIKTKDDKREFAVVLLFAYTGMRARDVRNLKLSSIDWNKNCINYIQSKTSAFNTIAIPYDLRIALLDYLKNSRPQIDNEYVFIQENGCLFKTKHYTNIVNKAFEKSKVDLKGRKHGCHVFRHSIATNMLNNHETLDTIADILGHHDASVAFNDYIKFDKRILKEISLEVPVWK